MGESNGKGSIIVVDDEQSVRDVIAMALRKKGYEVTTAANGTEALMMVAQQHFDLMFLDIKMPGMSGLDVLSRMATDYPSTTVVMLTAVTGMGAQMEAVRNEAFAYLTKPCDLEEVTQMAERLLGDCEAVNEVQPEVSA